MMEKKQYYVTSEELKAMAVWGSKSWKEVIPSNEKRSLHKLVQNYERFKVDMQGFLVYAGRQNKEHHNFQPVLNLWQILSDDNLLVGVRKNLLKDYLIENLGASLVEDVDGTEKLCRDKDKAVNWKLISEKGWWEKVDKAQDLSKYEIEAITKRINSLVGFIKSDKVKPEVRKEAMTVLRKAIPSESQFKGVKVIKPKTPKASKKVDKKVVNA